MQASPFLSIKMITRATIYYMAVGCFMALYQICLLNFLAKELSLMSFFAMLASSQLLIFYLIISFNYFFFVAPVSSA